MKSTCANYFINAYEPQHYVIDAVRASPHPTFHPLLVGQKPTSTTFATPSGGRGPG
ncbi:MAG: hypothetical protein P8179_08610 [Candidatus Thiodiazotropha sp.]